MKNILIIIVCFFALNQVQSQTKKQYLKAAEKSLAIKDYKSAMVNFQIAAEFDPGDPELLFKIAESARNFHAYTKAEQYYTLLQLSERKNEPQFKESLFGWVKFKRFKVNILKLRIITICTYLRMKVQRTKT